MQSTDLTVIDEILIQEKAATDPGAHEDEFFEFFAAQQVLRDYLLDPDEIRSGIVGQSTHPQSPGSDGGIDAMYILVNGRLIRDLDQAKDLKSLKQNIVFDVILIQATLETGFSIQRLLRLKDTSENIFRIDRDYDSFTETYNEPLLDQIHRFREAHKALITKHPVSQVNYSYVARADSKNVAMDVDSKAKALEQDIPEWLATISQCSFSFLGARDLIERYRKPPKSNFTLPCADSITSGSARLALVKLGNYKKLITSEKGELIEYLFESNVRDYQGEVEVNKQIRDTLTNSSDTTEFWWLNNGITILAREVGGTTTELVLDDPQIVNGLQTSIEIYEYLRLNPESPSAARHAVVRLIESPDENLQDRIIKATNSQTKIPPQYLRATDDLQRDIEHVFHASGMHYDRRKNSWRKLSIKIDKVIGMTELAQAVGAIYLQEPDHSRARPSRYFKEEHYKKVFSTKVPIELYVNCAILKRRAEMFLTTAESDKQHRNNLLFYLLAFAPCFAFSIPRAGVKLLTGQNACDLIEKAFEPAYKKIRPFYIQNGATDQAAKGTLLVLALKAAMLAEFSKPKKGGK
jgi:hypothetical protein